MIGIASFEQDLHGRIVYDMLLRKGVNVEYIPVDALSHTGLMHWDLDSDQSRVPTLSGFVDISDLSVLWWRRSWNHISPQEEESKPNRDEYELAKNDTRSALEWILLDKFQGLWVSNPSAQRLAANKLLQLRIARQCGLRVPKTIISQVPKKIIEFSESCNDSCVIKPVTGTNRKLTFARQVNKSDLVGQDRILEYSPCFYQEPVNGDKHYRVLAIGDRIHASLIEANSLDWRDGLDCSFSPVDLPARLCDQLYSFLKLLCLQMGVFDLKVSQETSEPVFLECNPQGQFLFVEGLSGQPLAESMSSFLADLL